MNITSHLGSKGKGCTCLNYSTCCRSKDARFIKLFDWGVRRGRLPPRQLCSAYNKSYMDCESLLDFVKIILI